MIHTSLSDSTLESLAACVYKLIANVTIPEDSSAPLNDRGMTEVTWLRLRFSDGSELELWPETIIPPAPFDDERFALFAEFRPRALLNPSGSEFRTNMKFIEEPQLTNILRNRVVLSVNVCGELNRNDAGLALRIDTSIQMGTDGGIFEFVSDRDVLPMRLGIRRFVDA